MNSEQKIKKPEGKLGILIPGIGAVSTTFIAGVFAVKKDLELQAIKYMLVWAVSIFLNITGIFLFVEYFTGFPFPLFFPPNTLISINRM